MNKLGTLLLASFLIFSGCMQNSETVKSEMNQISLVSDMTALNSELQPETLAEQDETDFTATLSVQEISEKYIRPFGCLVYTDDWTNANQIDGYMLLSWYREGLQEAMSIEKHYDEYSNNDLSAFLYPASEYEEFITRYLDLTVEELRADPKYQYNIDYNGYVIFGGARGERYELIINMDDITIQKDMITIKAKMINELGDFKAYKILTIKTFADESFHYESYITEQAS